MSHLPLSQPEPTDEALVAAVTQRDETAFALLYDRYHRAVYTLAAHSLGTHEAEEVVQDVFMRLWDKASQFNGERSRFSVWLMAIARHRVVDLLQRRSQQQREIAVEEVDRLLAEASDMATTVEEETWLRERGAIVLNALQTLPPEQRRVLVLAYFGGLSQSTMAEQLGWPLGTVKKRVRLGLQKLRAALSGERLDMATEAEQRS